jgi:hypothetical protein
MPYKKRKTNNPNLKDMKHIHIHKHLNNPNLKDMKHIHQYLDHLMHIKVYFQNNQDLFDKHSKYFQPRHILKLTIMGNHYFLDTQHVFQNCYLLILYHNRVHLQNNHYLFDKHDNYLFENRISELILDIDYLIYILRMLYRIKLYYIESKFVSQNGVFPEQSESS